MSEQKPIETEIFSDGEILLFHGETCIGKTGYKTTKTWFVADEICTKFLTSVANQVGAKENERG